MKIGKVIGALVEGILFAVFMWIGDKYFLDGANSFYVYAIYAIIFATAMFLYDKFANRKKKQKKNS